MRRFPNSLRLWYTHVLEIRSPRPYITFLPFNCLVEAMSSLRLSSLLRCIPCQKSDSFFSTRHQSMGSMGSVATLCTVSTPRFLWLFASLSSPSQRYMFESTGLSVPATILILERERTHPRVVSSSGLSSSIAIAREPLDRPSRFGLTSTPQAFYVRR